MLGKARIDGEGGKSHFFQKVYDAPETDEKTGEMVQVVHLHGRLRANVRRLEHVTPLRNATEAVEETSSVRFIQNSIPCTVRLVDADVVRREWAFQGPDKSFARGVARAINLNVIQRHETAVDFSQ